MVQIVLIRPGTSEFDEQGRIQGNLDIPLSDQGQREVQATIEELRPLGMKIIYSCPCEAAWQTASAIAQRLGIKAKQVEGFSNLDHGLWQGMQLEEVKRKQPKVFRQWQENPATVCPPEGEMISNCKQRAMAALAKLLKKQKEGVIGVVLPEPLAGILYCEVTHSETAEAWKANPRGAAWQLLGNPADVKTTAIDTVSQANGQPTGELTDATCLTPAANGILAKNGVNPGSISVAVPLEFHS
jgi:broad specificity phosphatase PhoE